jgi:hypothetical protein
VPAIDLEARPSDIIRKHDENKAGIDLTSKGAASTTKKIIEKSLESRHRLAMFDDVSK